MGCIESFKKISHYIFERFSMDWGKRGFMNSTWVTKSYLKGKKGILRFLGRLLVEYSKDFSSEQIGTYGYRRCHRLEKGLVVGVLKHIKFSYIFAGLLMRG